tara:strand:+ start:16255 stop:16488 length:234 start_codon:yes stop_codon:yes gene_type:complete
MTKQSPQDILEALHSSLATELSQRIKSGEATAADLSVARQFLKDNGIDAFATNDSPLQQLVDSLPFDTDVPDGKVRH